MRTWLPSSPWWSCPPSPVSQSISGWALAQRSGLLVLSLALWLILGIYLVPTLMKKLVGLMNDEVLLVFSLGLCFLMALLAQEIGLSTELGAFLAGSLLAGTVHAERVEHLVTPCKHLFGAVFFVSVGFMVQPAMIAQYIGPILLLSGAAIIGKLLFLTLGAWRRGSPGGLPCLRPRPRPRWGSSPSFWPAWGSPCR